MGSRDPLLAELPTWGHEHNPAPFDQPASSFWPPFPAWAGGTERGVFWGRGVPIVGDGALPGVKARARGERGANPGMAVGGCGQRFPKETPSLAARRWVNPLCPPPFRVQMFSKTGCMQAKSIEQRRVYHIGLKSQTGSTCRLSGNEKLKPKKGITWKKDQCQTVDFPTLAAAAAAAGSIREPVNPLPPAVPATG